MKFYYEPEDRIIESDELVRKFGTEFQIYELGIFPLSGQPDYEPFGFNDLGNGEYYPVESYTSMREKAIDALTTAGYTRAEAEVLLD